jgi:flagellum-specific ATP synthase
VSALLSAIDHVRATEPVRLEGRVAALRGLTVLVEGLPAPVGSLATIGTRSALGGDRLAEVVGFDHGRAILMLLGSTAGVRAGDRVVSHETEPTVSVGASLLGRVVDGMCRPIDGGPALRETVRRPLNPPPITAMERRRVTEPLATGVRTIDAMTPVGRGQRMGIFAGPGVGKSTLLGMIARGAGRAGSAAGDVNVIALIGERGREVKDFIEHALGPEGLAQSVVVVATSDESPLMRIRAASAACAVAEHFRGVGKDVVLMLDSVTRFAHAQRQVGLAVGEPPATRGYTPSVFAMLPTLLERAGAVDESRGGGSITGFYTVLVEGDDMTEPIADAARGILDGHLMLSRTLARRGQFPAIDVLDSVSRVASDVASADALKARATVIRLLAAYAEVEELLKIGAFTPGADAATDVAVSMRETLDALLAQDAGASEGYERTVELLRLVAQQAEQSMAAQKKQQGQGGAAGPGQQRRGG